MKGQRTAGVERSNSRENVTTVVAKVSAADLHIPPLVTCKADRLNPARGEVPGLGGSRYTEIPRQATEVIVEEEGGAEVTAFYLVPPPSPIRQQRLH